MSNGASESATGTPAAPDLRALLMQAVAAHRQGRLADARAGYEAILRIHPTSFDALHLLGVLALQRTETTKGVDLIRKAIEVNARDVTAHLNLARGLSDLGSMEEALLELDRAIVLKPDYAEAYANRGHVLAELKRPDEALTCCDKAIVLRPELAQAHINRSNALLALRRTAEALQSADRALMLNPVSPEACNNRGIALAGLDRADEALASYDRAIALRPDYAEAHLKRASALQALGRLPEAVAGFDRGVALKPDSVEAHFERANALQMLGRVPEAIAGFDRALALDPGHVIAHNNRADGLRSQGRLTEARSGFERAIALDPRYAEAYNNLANAVGELGHVEEALSLYDRAIELSPNLVEAHNNRGKALQDLLRHDDALASFANAAAIQPDYANAYWNESLTRLLLGQFEAGWKLYEWRWQVDKPKWPAGVPMWTGEESLEGKTIVLHAEQGLGDAIQFCRYAKLVAAKGATVVLEVGPDLVALMRNVEGVSRVTTPGERLARHDFHCPLLSLPFAFKTQPETIPADVPYLVADPQRRAHWRRRLGNAQGPRVGLVWAGSRAHQNDRNRSLALSQLLDALPAGLCCYSLQKELRDGDRELLRQRHEIVHLGDDLADLTDTAALLSELDLVLSVDTSVVHLASALGRPVWVMLPFAPDWRWLLDRDDSPWYPTARLFRQSALQDWASVLSRVRNELTATVLP